MNVKLCGCGCGEPARPGKRFARYHQLSVGGRALRWTGHKYEYNYRLVMEAHLGRKLQGEECVHHLNGIPNDDRLENLVLCASFAEHFALYHPRPPHATALFPCTMCGKEHRGALRSKHHFCSRACYKAWPQPERPHMTTTGAGKKVTFACGQCGKTVTRKGRGKSPTPFCSLACYHASLSGKSAGRKSNSRLLTLRGETLTLPEWARRLGVNVVALSNRHDMGWSDERCLTQPFRKSPACK